MFKLLLAKKIYFCATLKCKRNEQLRFHPVYIYIYMTVRKRLPFLILESEAFPELSLQWQGKQKTPGEQKPIKAHQKDCYNVSNR